MWSFLTEGEISKAQGGVFGGKKISTVRKHCSTKYTEIFVIQYV